MLWLGHGADALFFLVAVFADWQLLSEVFACVLLSVVSIQCYRQWGRKRARASDAPLLNRRAEQLVGRVVVLDQPIVVGKGRAKVDDAFWVVAGPDLPAGTPVRVVAVDGMTLKVQQL